MVVDGSNTGFEDGFVLSGKVDAHPNIPEPNFRELTLAENRDRNQMLESVVRDMVRLPRLEGLVGEFVAGQLADNMALRKLFEAEVISKIREMPKSEKCRPMLVAELATEVMNDYLGEDGKSGKLGRLLEEAKGDTRIAVGAGAQMDMIDQLGTATDNDEEVGKGVKQNVSERMAEIPKLLQYVLPMGGRDNVVGGWGSEMRAIIEHMHNLGNQMMGERSNDENRWWVEAVALVENFVDGGSGSEWAEQRRERAREVELQLYKLL